MNESKVDTPAGRLARKLFYKDVEALDIPDLIALIESEFAIAGDQIVFEQRAQITDYISRAQRLIMASSHAIANAPQFKGDVSPEVVRDYKQLYERLNAFTKESLILTWKPIEQADIAGKDTQAPQGEAGTIWLKQTHEKDGWMFGYYSDRPQDDAFIQYVPAAAKLDKSADEIAHEDSYWDDPLRGTNKC